MTTKTIMIASISVLVAVMMVSSAVLPADAMTKVPVCPSDGETDYVSPKKAENLIAKGQATDGPCPPILVSSMTVSGELQCKGNDPTLVGTTPGLYKSNAVGNELLANFEPPIECNGSETTNFSDLTVSFECTELSNIGIVLFGEKDGVIPEESRTLIDALQFKGGISVEQGEKILLRAAASAIVNCNAP